MPDSKAVSPSTEERPIQKAGCVKSKTNCFSEINRICGNNKVAIRTAIPTEIKVIKVASVKNCPMMEERPAPITFRTPTSLARLEALAVAKFTKLMQEIINNNSAAKEKMRTYSIRPPIALAWSSKSLNK